MLGEYNKIASSPLLLLDETMQDAAYDKHTYKHTTIGFLKDIVDMPNQYDYSRKFFERWYRPDNCIVLVVGDVRHKEVVELARRQYSGWKRGAAQVEIPVEPPQTAERRRDLEWKGVTQPYLYIGYHVPGFDAKSRDIAALDVLGEGDLLAGQPALSQAGPGRGSRRDDHGRRAVSSRSDPVHDHGPSARCGRHARDRERSLRGAGRRGGKANRSAAIGRHQVAHALWLCHFARFDECRGPLVGLVSRIDGRPRFARSNVRNVRTSHTRRRSARGQQFFKPENRTVVTLLSEKDAAAKTQVATADGDAKPPADKPNKPAPEKTAQAKPKSKPAPTAGGGSKSDAAGGSPLVTLRIAFRAGSQDDPPGKEGLAALTARMLSEGWLGRGFLFRAARNALPPGRSHGRRVR